MNKHNQIIGIDPDIKGHGVAVYVDGKLTSLANMKRNEIIAKFRYTEGICFSIENTLANNMLYARNKTRNPTVDQKIMRNVGMCQQSQQELMDDLYYYGIPFILHKPQKGNWAKNKAEFERVTGWSGRSNEETRSAAFFGFLSLRQ